MGAAGGRRGSALYMMVGGIAALFGAAAWVVDIGAGMKERSHMQAAADAGALGAAFELKNGASAAASAGKAWVGKNGYDVTTGAVTTWNLPSGQPAVSVKWKQPIKTTFGAIFGVPSFDVAIASSATLGGLMRIPQGAMPFGLPAYQNASGTWYGLVDDSPETYAPLAAGVRLQLKTGAGGGKKGNYLPLALDGTGASTYADAIVNGAHSAIDFDSVVSTETGNMAGPTRSGVSGRLARGAAYADIFVPMIPKAEWDSNNGRSTVTVIGFVMARLEPVVGSAVYADFVNKILPFPGSTGTNRTPLAYAPVLVLTP
ncbi:MAG: Protein of unknown function rane [Cyanobacteria bacterium RYN_339]|nr:Protein of unknown function rane [Cyanobacteria bacterium RYN_339]